MKWLKWTIVFAIVGIMALPLVFMGLASCCSGGPTFLQSIPAWPVWPIILLIRGFAFSGGSIWPLLMASAFGYGLIPTYYVLLRALWRRMLKPCA